MAPAGTSYLHPTLLEKVKEALTKAGVYPGVSGKLAWFRRITIKLTGAQATQMVRLIEALEEHDDVQHVYANFDIDEWRFRRQSAQTESASPILILKRPTELSGRFAFCDVFPRIGWNEWHRYALRT